MAFSDVINDAKEKGFTEPDPRDDLSGTDVARKVTSCRLLAVRCSLFAARCSLLHHEERRSAACSLHDPPKRAAGEHHPTSPLWQVTILARACGIPVDLNDVPVASLVPPALEDWAPADGEVLADAFVAQMKAYDDENVRAISRPRTRSALAHAHATRSEVPLRAAHAEAHADSRRLEHRLCSSVCVHAEAHHADVGWSTACGGGGLSVCGHRRR
jgi:hypothetical protein